MHTVSSSSSSHSQNPNPNPMPDDKILTYKDTTILRSDLQILRSPSFINDRIISFFFSHLLSSIKTPQILLLPPSISFLLSHCPNPSFSLHKHSLILFPVNNNETLTLAEGGTHWSLLVYYKKEGVFVHYDSCGGMNGRHARRLYEGVKGFVGGRGMIAGFVEGDTWQQGNGYDCGAFVMAAAREVCLGFEEGKGVGRLGVEGGEVGRLRGEVLELVFGLGGRE